MKAWGRHEYGKLYEQWPTNAEGDKEKPVFLTGCSPLDLEAESLQAMLRAYGIPSIRTAPGDGQFGELILGMSGTGVDIYVPESMLEDAKVLMEGEVDDDSLEEGI